MSDLITYWWPVLALPAFWMVTIWLAGVRRRYMESFTRVCPTCGGSGRINKDIAS